MCVGLHVNPYITFSKACSGCRGCSNEALDDILGSGDFANIIAKKWTVFRTILTGLEAELLMIQNSMSRDKYKLRGHSTEFVHTAIEVNMNIRSIGGRI